VEEGVITMEEADTDMGLHVYDPAPLAANVTELPAHIVDGKGLITRDGYWLTTI
jgi:hypothetical protein